MLQQGERSNNQYGCLYMLVPSQNMFVILRTQLFYGLRVVYVSLGVNIQACRTAMRHIMCLSPYPTLHLHIIQPLLLPLSNEDDNAFSSYLEDLMR